MRNRFLTVYDYGTGGVWQYIYAESAEQITSKYPQLKVFTELPDWWATRPLQNLRSYDIDAAPDELLKALTRD